MGTVWRVPVELKWTGTSGSPGTNTWHISETDDTGNPLGSRVDRLKDFYTAIRNLFPTDYTWTFAGEAVGVAGDGNGELRQLDPWAVQGNSGSSAYLPPATQVCMTLKTASALRSGRGRIFLGPLGAGNMDGNGTPTQDCLNAIAEAADDLLAAGPLEAVVCVWSPTRSTSYDVQSVQLVDKFASLRSRRD